MSTLFNTYSNAKKSIQLLQTFPLDPDTKNNIKKLKEILCEEEINHSCFKNQERNHQNLEQEVESPIVNQNEKERNNCISNHDVEKIKEENQDIMSKIHNHKFLQKIIQEIQHLLSMNDQFEEEKPNAESKQNIESSEHFGSDLSVEICSLLLKISEQIKIFIKNSNNVSNKNENNSNCSYNTHPNANSDSNSGSIRSLLTEKLRQFAQEDFDDPEYKNQRIVIQGNLMRELSKCSRGSKPMMVSRKFQDLSEPFSMQNKHFNEKQLQNWFKSTGKKEQKGRVHSQRTILGEINLSQSHLKEKRAKKEETGCSRCEIY